MVIDVLYVICIFKCLLIQKSEIERIIIENQIVIYKMH